MNIEGLNLNLHNLDAPRSRQDVIAMLEEACAQVALMNECMATLLRNAEHAANA